MRRDRIGCRDFLRAKLSRRTVLKVGGLGLAGLSLPALLQPEPMVYDQLHRPMPISAGRPLHALLGS